MFESFEVEFLPQLAPEQQKINTGLKNLGRNRQIPDVFDFKSGCARDQNGRQNEEEQPCHRAEKWRPGVADSLEDA